MSLRDELLRMRDNPQWAEGTAPGSPEREERELDLHAQFTAAGDIPGIGNTQYLRTHESPIQHWPLDDCSGHNKSGLERWAEAQGRQPRQQPQDTYGNNGGFDVDPNDIGFVEHRRRHA